MKKAEKYTKQFLQAELAIIESTERINELPILNVFEKTIIYKYSNDGYENLNEGLRNNKRQNNSEFGLLLEKCLNKLSNYSGLVYRGIFLNQEEKKQVPARNGK